MDAKKFIRTCWRVRFFTVLMMLGVLSFVLRAVDPSLVSVEQILKNVFDAKAGELNDARQAIAKGERLFQADDVKNLDAKQEIMQVAQQLFSQARQEGNPGGVLQKLEEKMDELQAEMDQLQKEPQELLRAKLKSARTMPEREAVLSALDAYSHRLPKLQIQMSLLQELLTQLKETLKPLGLAN